MAKGHCHAAFSIEALSLNNWWDCRVYFGHSLRYLLTAAPLMLFSSKQYCTRCVSAVLAHSIFQMCWYRCLIAKVRFLLQIYIMTYVVNICIPSQNSDQSYSLCVARKSLLLCWGIGISSFDLMKQGFLFAQSTSSILLLWNSLSFASSCSRAWRTCSFFLRALMSTQCFSILIPYYYTD